jgi:predicted phage tail protein
MRMRRPLTYLAACVAASCAGVMIGQLPAQAAADSTPPTVPAGLRSTSATSNSVSLAWTPSTDRSGEVSYRIYVNGARRGDTTQTTHTEAGLDNNTSYTFAVRAVDRYGNVSRSSSPLTASTTGRRPTAPSALRATEVGYDTVSLTWEPVGGPVNYYLIHRDGLWVNSSYSTTGNVAYLAAGSTHTIEVRALGPDNTLSEPATVMVTTRPDRGPPTVPANLHVVTDGAGRPTGLAWDTASDDRGVGWYRLRADGGEAFSGGQGVSFYSLTDEYCTVFSGRTYSFTVQAVDLSGNVSGTSAPLRVTVP